MSNMTSESEDRLVANSYIDSPSIEEVSSEGNVAGGGLLKKGPWTSAEDAILVDYVNKHGEGNWNAVQKHAGLSRCGKSCRLRWANHLRPDLKKGAFTPDEERHIIELHANMGNKWARMAAEKEYVGLDNHAKQIIKEKALSSEENKGQQSAILALEDKNSGMHTQMMVLMRENTTLREESAEAKQLAIKEYDESPALTDKIMSQFTEGYEAYREKVRANMIAGGLDTAVLDSSDEEFEAEDEAPKE